MKLLIILYDVSAHHFILNAQTLYQRIRSRVVMARPPKNRVRAFYMIAFGGNATTDFMNISCIKRKGPRESSGYSFFKTPKEVVLPGGRVHLLCSQVQLGMLSQSHITFYI